MEEVEIKRYDNVQNSRTKYGIKNKNTKESLLIDFSSSLTKGNFSFVYKGSLTLTQQSDNDNNNKNISVVVKKLHRILKASNNMFKITKSKTTQEIIDLDTQIYTTTLKEFEKELLFLKKFQSSKFFVDLIGYKITDKYFLLVFKSCFLEPIDKLLEKIYNETASTPSNILFYLFTGIISGMQVIQSYNIFHHDLKPSNLLIDFEGVPKISDFGLANKTSKGIVKIKNGILVGTELYLPYETRFSKSYDLRSESWAIAITFAQIILKKEIEEFFTDCKLPIIMFDRYLCYNIGNNEEKEKIINIFDNDFGLLDYEKTDKWLDIIYKELVKPLGRLELNERKFIIDVCKENENVKQFIKFWNASENELELELEQTTALNDFNIAKLSLNDALSQLER